MQTAARWTALALAATLLAASPQARAQAASIPSAQAGPELPGSNHGRQLLDQMVAALGGDAWLHRKNWKATGNFGIFYKGKPGDLSTLKFEEFHRVDPWSTRFIVISHMGSNIGELLGIPVGSDHKDIVQILTPDNAYEITYRGKKEMPKDTLPEQEQLLAHTVDVVVGWLKQPGTGVFYEGTHMAERRLVETVSVINPQDETVTLELDLTTHLPVSREFRYRDAVFHDLDLDREEYDNYQLRDGVMTPFTVTRFHNGDMVAQRFLTDIHYNLPLEPALFDPDVPLSGKPPKK